MFADNIKYEGEVTSDCMTFIPVLSKVTHTYTHTQTVLMKALHHVKLGSHY